jgi:hypothetical protein
MLLANAQVSPNIACAVDGKATKGWATINALQFLEGEPWINILTIRWPIAATGQNFQGFRR